MIAAERQSPVIDREPKCWRCGRTLFGMAGRPWEKKCEKCNAMNRSEPMGEIAAMSRRPQPQADFIYGGHYSPLLARLLRRRLPDGALVTAWHRYYGDGPMALLAVAVLPGLGKAWTIMPLPPIGRKNRALIARRIDRMADNLREELQPRAVC